jgi:peptidyl-tRNA hydrolase, PTH1 family
MKYLIVGLGNPGSEYENTRHNIGFMILDYLAKENGAVKFNIGRHSNIAEIKHKGRTLILIKPTTFMNLSGKAVQYWMQAEKIAPENLLVVLDDLALPFGSIRLRESGSDAGHNGLKDINLSLGHQQYARLRFGIGNNYPKGMQADYVLSPFSKEEQISLNERIEMACSTIKSFVSIGAKMTMTQFNNK